MSEYVKRREEIAAKAKQLHEASEALGKDNANIAGAAVALRLDANADSRAVAAEMQRRVVEITALRQDFEPFKAIEDAKTLANEFEKAFNMPAEGNILPQPRQDDRRDAERKTLGQLFVGSKAYQAFKQGRLDVADTVPVDIMATLFETGAGWPVESPASSQVSLMPKRPIAVVDFIPKIRWSEAIYTFMEETTHTDNAVEKAEGVAFGEGAFVLTKREKNVRKIPNMLPVTDEQITDVPGAEDFVKGRLEYQIRARLDLQCLAGNGTAPNIEGTENVTGIQSQALGADSTEDAIYKMLRAIEDDGFASADVVFIRAAKFEAVRLRKTADGIYLYGPPSQTGPLTLWGLPVVKTNACTSTKAVSGAYQAHSLLAIRQDIEFAIGYVNAQFGEGEKTIRADLRAAMVHLRPKAFGQVTGL